MAVEGSLAAEERQAALLAALRDHGRVEIEEAAERFGVHPMTIRRSLKALERAGRARLVRGGAVHVGTEEFEIRQSRALSAKRRIAEKLRPEMSRHESIGLDASSTVHVLAGEMPDVDHLLVVTYGIPTFQQLQGHEGIQVISSGENSINEQAASWVWWHKSRSNDSLCPAVFCQPARSMPRPALWNPRWTKQR